jgi:hypothetical protein
MHPFAGKPAPTVSALFTTIEFDVTPWGSGGATIRLAREGALTVTDNVI